MEDAGEYTCHGRGTAEQQVLTAQGGEMEEKALAMSASTLNSIWSFRTSAKSLNNRPSLTTDEASHDIGCQAPALPPAPSTC